MWLLCLIRQRSYAKKINADHSKGLSTVLGSGIWLNYSAGLKKMQISWRDTGFDRYLGSSICQNLGMGYSIGKKTVLWDRDDRSLGCGTIMKNAPECGIRTPLTVPDKVTAMALSLLQCQIHPAHGLDLFLNVCVNLMFNLSHSNFFSQLYSTTCITPKHLQ